MVVHLLDHEARGIRDGAVDLLHGLELGVDARDLAHRLVLAEVDPLGRCSFSNGGGAVREAIADRLGERGQREGQGDG